MLLGRPVKRPKVGPLSGSALPSSPRSLSCHSGTKYLTSGVWGLNPRQMWWVTAGYSGLICTDVIQVSSVKPDGTVTDIHSITLFLGWAGTSVAGPFTIMSG